MQIESLWGLPEGLYYNAHDNYVVDTQKRDIDAVSKSEVKKFSVREKKNYKGFCVSTTESGKWETLPIKPPFDWKASLSESDAQKIAYESRRIAKLENKAVSIMWFIGIPLSLAQTEVIPWYHEMVDVPIHRSSLATRKKTSFDQCYVIRSSADLEDLQSKPIVTTPASRIRIQPQEEKLLRDKTTLKRIGELAKSKSAILILEGAVLSHAYYQLMSTGATVEVVYPFIGFDERLVYNKLVRDNVPDIIRERGEHITTAVLEGENLVKALSSKLVEEAYEVMDAKDVEATIAELADVMEVVDVLIQKLGISKAEIEEEQIKKRQKRGSFQKGIMLVETESKPPTSRQVPDAGLPLEGILADVDQSKVIGEAEMTRRYEALERRADRRIAGGTIEVKASVTIPAVRNGQWTIETGKEIVANSNGRSVIGKLKGERNGSQWNLEVSVVIDETQLLLF